MPGRPADAAPPPRSAHYVIVTEAGPGRVRLALITEPASAADPASVAGSRKGRLSASVGALTATSRGEAVGSARLSEGDADAYAEADADGQGEGGEAIEVAESEFAATVARLEREHPRWVWSDTTRWYPGLLAAGVRIERCVDLRLSHAILRHSSLTTASTLAKSPPDEWDTAPRIDTVASTSATALAAPHQATLFDILDEFVELRSAPVGATTSGHSRQTPRVNAGRIGDRINDAEPAATDPAAVRTGAAGLGATAATVQHAQTVAAVVTAAAAAEASPAAAGAAAADQRAAADLLAAAGPRAAGGSAQRPQIAAAAAGTAPAAAGLRAAAATVQQAQTVAAVATAAAAVEATAAKASPATGAAAADHRAATDLHAAAAPAAPQAPELTEWHRQRAAVAGANDPSRIALLLAAESAGSLVAAEMQHAGLPWSAELHDDLLTRLLGPRPAAPGIRPARLEELLASIRTLLDDPTANPDSPVELVKSLRRAGLNVTSTRSWELKEIDHPAIPPLLEYKKLSRLLTANGWNWVDTWVRDGRFHPNYIPGGVVTGRWASEGGGALQLPKQVRSAVVADPGWKLVVADAAQLEPRILAALAGDRAMAAAGRDRDLYDGIVASGAVDTRAHAKLGMLGAMYGGTTGESGRMLPRLARAYPAAIKFVEDAARAGEAGAVVTTRLGRTSPRPSDAWQDVQDAAGADNATEAARSRARSAARSWGRFTRNFVVQGTAAEWALCWIGAIRRRLWLLDAPTTASAPDTTARLEQRPHLAFFLHDEVMVHAPAHLADTVAEELRAAALEAGRLIFGDAPVQFPVTVAIVDSYDQAK